jgi:hypothetical protein
MTIFSPFPVIFGLLAAENDNFIDRGQAERILREWEHGYCPQEVIALFAEVPDMTLILPIIFGVSLQ